MLADKFGNQSPSVGRYQTWHLWQGPAPVDLKGSTGDKATMVVAHPKIEILGFGWVVSTALGAATTINAVVALDKQPKDAGARAILSALATLTFDGAAAVLGTYQEVDLNTGQSGTPLEGPQSRPTAVYGDQLIFELTTAGTGSAVQTVIPWIMYRERTT